MFTYIYIYVHVYIYIFINVYVYTFIFMNIVCMLPEGVYRHAGNIYTHTRMCTRMYIYTYLYICI